MVKREGKMKNNKDNIDWNLAGKIVSGEATENEHQKFNIWLEKDNNVDVWNQIQFGLDQTDFVLTKEKIDIDKAWNNVQSKTGLKKRNYKIYYTYAAIAASILIIIGIFLSYPIFNNNNNFTSLKTEESIKQIQLADGSVVNINRNSVLNYPAVFETHERSVSLNGEAFFEIAKDHLHPFVIKTNSVKIKVVGTSFNVKESTDYNLCEVIVKTGVVEVSSLNDSENKVLLNVGEKAIFNSQSQKLIKEENSNRNYLAWKTKEITFKNDYLNSAINLLEEVYNVKINNTETINPETKITATFEKNTIDFIINTINKTHNLTLNYTTKE